MKHLTLLLPFGLPPTETAQALLREVQAPALGALLARSAGAPLTKAVDPFARALAHETWLAQQFGLIKRADAHASANSAANDPSSRNADSSPPVALAAMAALGLPAAQGHWFMLQPSHIHVARDHLVLTGMRQLSLEAAEARALFDAAQPLFAETGKTLLYGSADTWFMRADEWADLSTATPDAASGRNIDIWMPRDNSTGTGTRTGNSNSNDIKAGSSARAWRKLQNEIQMQWFTDPVNEKREAAGEKPVNSLWLWGGAGSDATLQGQGQAKAHYESTFNLSGWMQLFGGNGTTYSVDAAEVIASESNTGLLLLDALIEPGLTNEWTYWLERIETLEKNWFAPLLAALRAGKLEGIRLVLTGQDRQTDINVSRASLYKFWQQPSLQRLAS